MPRQWRSDDTDQWKEGFGKGSLGDITIGGATTLGATQHANYRTFTGTSGNSSGTLNSAIEYTGWVLIIQHYGSGASNWELNYIQNSSSSATATLKYQLQHTYVTGAQLITSGDYNNWTINANLTVPNWNGSINGVCFLHAKESITGSGQIVGNGLTGAASTGTGQLHTSGRGGRGGSGRNNSGGTGRAWRGDGSINNVFNGTNSHLSGGGTGGGGAVGDDYVGGGGANGGNGGDGQNPGRTGAFGRGGAAGGNAELTLMVMGGGGGGGSRFASGASWGAGGSGGAIVFLLAPTITLTSLNVALSGGNGGNAFKGSGGGGAGGSLLLKGIDVNVGTGQVVASGGIGPSNDIKAGNGSVGRIHIDYSGSITGTTSPALSSRLDATIKGGGGGNFFAFF